MSCSGSPGAQRHAIAVAGAGMRGCGREIGAAIAAGRHDGDLGADAVDHAIIHIDGDHAAAFAVFHDQVDDEIFDHEFGIVADALAIQRMQHGMAGAVGGGAGAQRGRAFAIFGGHAAKGALINLAFFGAGKRYAEMLQFKHGGGRFAAQKFDGVLIAQPVGALDGVIHVPAPVVFDHVAERGGNAALRRHRMAAGREYLGDVDGLQARLRAAQRRPQSGTAGANNNNIVGMISNWIGRHVTPRSQSSVLLQTGRRQATAQGSPV